MSKAADSAAGRAYMVARKGGADGPTARQKADEVRQRVVAEQRLAGSEFDRLRLERDALLSELAKAWGVSDSEALRIVRLDLGGQRDQD